ncbi:MAG: hypothetical protein RSB91_00665 [Clostridia bacterium]
MKKYLRMGLALMLAFCLCAGAASASVTGLDNALSHYLDVNDDVRLSFDIELKQLVPFGDSTIEMMNALLKHITMSASIRDGGAETAMQLSVDGEAVLSLAETNNGAGTSLQTPLLPNRTLTSAGSALGVMGGVGEEEAFDALNAIDEVKACYNELTDAIRPFAEEKKASYKIASIGSARWVRLAKLSAEQCEQLAPFIARVLSCGMDSAYREELAKLTYNKGLTVALYQTAENGKDMAVYIKGNVTDAEGETRKLSYQWAFLDGGTERKDTYKFELFRSKGVDERRVIKASYSQKRLTDRFSLNGSCETALQGEAGNVTTTVKQELSGQDKEGSRSFEGTQTRTVKTKENDDTTTVVTKLTPKLRLTSAEGGGVLSGTVALEELLGKEARKALTIRFSDEPGEVQATGSGAAYAVTEPAAAPTRDEPETFISGSSLAQNEDVVTLATQPDTNAYSVGQPPIGLQDWQTPASMQTIDLDTASPAELEALMTELAQRLAGRLLTALSKLPQEDTALLRDTMSEADYAEFLNLISGQ